MAIEIVVLTIKNGVLHSYVSLPESISRDIGVSTSQYIYIWIYIKWYSSDISAFINWISTVYVSRYIHFST